MKDSHSVYSRGDKSLLCVNKFTSTVRLQYIREVKDRLQQIAEGKSSASRLANSSDQSFPGGEINFRAPITA